MRRADEWSMDELIAQVGSVDRAAARKALMTWVDLGVLKEDGATWKLLERAEAGSAPSNVTASRSGTFLELNREIRVRNSDASYSSHHRRTPSGSYCSTAASRADESILEGERDSASFPRYDN